MGLRLEYRPGADLTCVVADGAVQHADCQSGRFLFSENLSPTISEAVEVSRNSAHLPLAQRPWALRITFKKEY
jgi:hypothetical protein